MRCTDAKQIFKSSVSRQKNEIKYVEWRLKIRTTQNKSNSDNQTIKTLLHKLYRDEIDRDSQTMPDCSQTISGLNLNLNSPFTWQITTTLTLNIKFLQ